MPLAHRQALAVVSDPLPDGQMLCRIRRPCASQTRPASTSARRLFPVVSMLGGPYAWQTKAAPTLCVGGTCSTNPAPRRQILRLRLGLHRYSRRRGGGRFSGGRSISGKRRHLILSSLGPRRDTNSSRSGDDDWCFNVRCLAVRFDGAPTTDMLRQNDLRCRLGWRLNINPK